MPNNMQKIIVDNNSPLFNKDGLQYKEFPSDFGKIRYFALHLASAALSNIKETNLLEQQISELLKNAIVHGNKFDPQKTIKVWYCFDKEAARIIVEDQGDGFKKIKEWNEFNQKRLDCLQKRDFKQLENFISFRTEHSRENDNGNALFAALEYWNSGIVFNSKGNTVAAKRNFIN